MKLKKYKWNGFGFPIIFEELPATKLQGKLVPDVDWSEVGKLVAIFVCSQQKAPLSSNQIKFLRTMMSKNLREFAHFAGVKHPSVIRWEKNGAKPAQVEVHIEIVLRIKILKYLGVKIERISEALNHAEDIESFRSNSYRNLKPIRVSEDVIRD